MDFGAWDGVQQPPTYIDDVLQNPSVNHRLKLENVSLVYDPNVNADAPAGVLRIAATFSNVTEVSLESLYFTVADLEPGDVLLNADSGPGGLEATVPDDALGDDGILHPLDRFTFEFLVGLAETRAGRLTVDANGVPHDWFMPDPKPSYDANDTSFVFGGPAPFVRGEVNGDGEMNITDPIVLIFRLFLGSDSKASCLDASDANDDGVTDVSDAVYLLNWMFVDRGAPPPTPHPQCGFDETVDALDCSSFNCR